MLLAVFVAVIVLFLPGYLGFRVIGQSRSFSLALAPLFSSGLFGLLGIVYAMIGVPSGVISVFIMPTTALALLLILLSVWRGKTSSDGRKLPLSVIALAAIFGLLVGGYVFVLRLPRTDAIFQGWDNIAHLNFIRAFFDSGNWSSLHPSGYLTAGDMAISPVASGTFYPAVWHEVCALVVLMSGAEVAKAINAVNYVFASLVYPLGTVCALRVFFGQDRRTLYCGAIVSVSFAQFPWVLIIFGPIFPNLASFCCIPAALALGGSAIRSLFERKHSIPSILMLLAICLSLGLLQPNALFTFAIMLFFYVGWTIFSHASSYRIAGHRISSLACMDIFYAICLVLWIAIYHSPFIASLLTYHWDSYANVQQACINVLTAGYGYGFGQNTPAQLLLAFMVIVGILAILKQGRHSWMVQTYFLVCIMCIVDAATDGQLKSILCSIWYTDPSRVASMCAMAAVPLAAVGLTETVAFFHRTLAPTAKTSALSPLGVAVGVVACFAFLNFARFYAIPGWQQAGIQDAYGYYDGALQSYYSLDADTSALTQEEQDFADEVVSIVPEDALVINDPADGSLVLYGTDGLRCYYRTGFGYGADEGESADSQLIRTSLNDISTNQAVREAADRIGARYVLLLDRGDMKMTWLRFMVTGENDFEGITDIDDDTPGFKLILEQDGMRLYEIAE